MKTTEELFSELKDLVLQNPGLWRAFAKETEQICRRRDEIKAQSPNATFPSISVRDWFGKARWDKYTVTVDADPDGFKLNNNHAAGFLRMFLAVRPRWREYFTVKESKLDQIRPGMYKDLIVQARQIQEAA